MLAASARGEGAAYEKKRKARAKKEEAADQKKLAAQKWRVSVTVNSAEIYLSTDSNGLSDPYAEVYVGDDDSWRRIGSTKVISETMKPEWNETFEATVTGLQTLVKVKLYDKDKFGSDYIGTWKTYAQGRGGVGVDFHPKGNHKLITAKANITITWTQK